MRTIILSVVMMTTCFLSSRSYSQNALIDYQSWNPSSPPCNIFAGGVNVPATVGGNSTTIAHGSLYGQPKYNKTALAIELPVEFVNSSDTRGTQYRFAYNFKQNYSYQITFNAAEAVSTQGTADLLNLKVTISNSSGSTNPPCNGPENRPRDVNTATPLAAHSQYYDYSVSFSRLSAPQTSLDVTAYPGSQTTGANAVRIRKITITETAPPPSFTLSPATVSIPCGSTSPVTFTVTNVNNTPGVTGYIWNLGTTPNGWIYSGAAAPSTITTTTNTLTLTPVSGAAPQDVSATVQLGTVQLNTNTAAVTLQQPSLSISGPNSFCTTSDYYGIDNLPANSSVHWYDYSGITTPNTPNATTTTLTVNPGQAGVASLYAVVNTGCGNPIDVWLENIHAGSADAVSYTEFSSNGFGQPTLCRHPYDYDDYANTFAAYLEYPAVGAVNLTYRISEYPDNQTVYLHTIYDFQEGQTYPLPADLNAGQYTFEAWTTNSCGTAPFVFSELITYDDCTQLRQTISATVYPNPASSNLNVYVTDATSKTQTVSPQMRFTLYDMTNSRVVKAWQMAGGQKQYSLNIAGVRKGNYFLHIMKGNQKVVKQVRIE